MPPQGVDMGLIREALARRRGTEAGGAIPATAQQTAPQGALPSGAPNTPRTPTPQADASGANLNVPGGQPTAVNQILKGAQATQGPQFDDDTKKLSKALVKKLIDVLG